MEQRLEFKVHGLDCMEEVSLLKAAIGPLVTDTEQLNFDVMQGKMIVQADGLTAEQVIEAAASVGLEAEPWSSKPDHEAVQSWRSFRTLSLFLSVIFLVSGFVLHLKGGGDPRYFYAFSLGLSLWPALPKALAAGRIGRADMNLLMVVAVVGAIFIGEWVEAAVVSLLFGVSQLLETWSVDRARKAVQKLLNTAPSSVRVVRNGQELECSPEEVEVGTVFIVKPGEGIALDGRIVKGSSEVNQAPITGESFPVSKDPGDEVFAGCINGSGALEVESTRPADDTTLAKVVRLVKEAHMKRAPSERWVEQFARIYTPIVMVLALLVFLVPLIFVSAAEWETWLYRALVLLVIACPCALVISTPVSIVAALARAAKEGVLIKGGLYLEQFAELQAVAFDKTGTLTKGQPRVTEVIPLSGHTEEELLARAAALEVRSHHPLAQAILEKAEEMQVEALAAEDCQALPGKGVSGQVDGRWYWLGSHRYLEERGQETPEVHERIEALSRQGRSVVVVGSQDHVCGLLTIEDLPRDEARATVTLLHQMGVEQILITGDNRQTAEAIAKRTGIDRIYAELLPHDKIEHVSRLMEKYGSVAMVGDGINDAPAMARASVGVAMGGVGSDAAIETADVALMADDLTRLPWLVGHARRTRSVIRQNIGFSLLTKLAVFVLSVAGWASLWAAIAADTGVSLLVTLNGLSLLKSDRA